MLEEVEMARGMRNFWDKTSPYEKWIESVGVPIHHGYYVEDCRTEAYLNREYEWSYTQKKTS
jgi:hypothetical protein